LVRSFVGKHKPINEQANTIKEFFKKYFTNNLEKEKQND